MATNDILSVAESGGANVNTQAEYAAMTTILANGLLAGVVPSKLFNKIIRQSSLMSYVLAQLIVDISGDSVADNGTPATILASLKKAISAYAGTVGATRNLKASIAAASTSCLFTADEIITKTALGGSEFTLATFSKTINIAGTGVNGMDTGLAPATGYVAIYAIYNPTTLVSGLLGVDSTSILAPEVYGGANMPAGYTASALVSVLGTNGTRQFKVAEQQDRKISTGNSTILNNSTIVSSITALNAAAAVPMNAKSAGGSVTVSSTAATTISIILYDAVSAVSLQGASLGISSIYSCSFYAAKLTTPQALYFTTSNSNGTPTFGLSINRYEI